MTVKNDRKTEITHDRREHVGNDETLVVDNDRKMSVKGKQEHTTTGDHISLVKGTKSLEVKGNLAQKISGALGFKVRGDIVLESSSRISLKVGGAFIDIHPGGVDIMGPKMNLNSGGNPGTPAGIMQLDALTDDKEDESSEQIYYSLTDEDGNAVSGYRYRLSTEEKSKELTSGESYSFDANEEKDFIFWLDIDRAEKM